METLFNLGTRHFQILLIALVFFKNEWVISTVAPSDGMFSTSGFRSMHEKFSQSGSNSNWYIYPTLFTGKLLAALAPLFLCSKYIILATSLVQSIALLAVPLVLTLKNLDILTITFITIETMTIFQLPAAYTLMSRWTPHEELGRHLSGLSIGTYFAFFLFVQMERFFPMEYSIMNYVGGSLVIIWSFIWLIFCAPDPHKCFYISKEEKQYLFQNIPHIRKVAINVPVPLKKILSCLPLYGFLLADISVEVYKLTGRHFRLTNSFFINIIHLQLDEAPHSIATMLILNCTFVFTCGFITDKLIARGINLNNTRKSISSVALWGSGICLAFLGCLSVVGHLAVPFDIAQNYAGFIIGLSKAISTLLFPVLDNLEKEVIRKAVLKEAWNRYSYITGGGIFIANTLFLMCGTIYKRDFDNVGTLDWRHESIHSYP